jgi:hypothetical protein
MMTAAGGLVAATTIPAGASRLLSGNKRLDITKYGSEQTFKKVTWPQPRPWGEEPDIICPPNVCIGPGHGEPNYDYGQGFNGNAAVYGWNAYSYSEIWDTGGLAIQHSTVYYNNEYITGSFTVRGGYNIANTIAPNWIPWGQSFTYNELQATWAPISGQPRYTLFSEPPKNNSDDGDVEWSYSGGNMDYIVTPWGGGDPIINRVSPIVLRCIPYAAVGSLAIFATYYAAFGGAAVICDLAPPLCFFAYAGAAALAAISHESIKQWLASHDC